MKKSLLNWLSVASLMLILAGCSLFGRDETDNGNGTEDPVEQPAPDDNGDTDPVEEPDDNDEVNQNLEAWLPRLSNVVYKYEGEGNEFASFTWNPQFNRDDYYQTATNNGGTVMVDILNYSTDEITRVFRRPETYFRDNFTDIGTISTNPANEALLKTPIAVGTSWSTEEADYEITAVDAEIQVPAGTYRAIEVTSTYDNTVIKRYYAEEIGLVYEVTETEGTTIESKLAEILTNTPEVLHLTVFQSDDQAMGLDQIEAELALNTNDPARLSLQKLLRGEMEGYEDIFLLPEGTEINYLFLNSENVVEIDLSSDYVSNMNAGSAGEMLFLSGLANTLIRYYGAEEVLLTIDGQNYESGHIVLQDGETLSFNEELINE